MTVEQLGKDAAHAPDVGGGLVPFFDHNDFWWPVSTRVNMVRHVSLPYLPNFSFAS